MQKDSGLLLKDNLKKDKIVLIEWDDSCSDTSGWRPKEYYKQEASVSKCQSTGYLLRQTRTSVTVYQNKSFDTGNISDVMTIPRKAITKITYLESKET